MREYWGDSTLFLRLDAAEREIYVGLWSIADDEGWLPRDVPAIAALLYRFEIPSEREARVSKVLGRLRELGKLVSHRCCIELPTVRRYPRSGKKSTDHRDDHRKHSSPVKAIRTDTNPSPDLTLPVPDPSRRPARAREGVAARGGPMENAASAAGGFVADLAKRRGS